MSSVSQTPEWDIAVVLAHAVARDGEQWRRVGDHLSSAVLLIDTGELVARGIEEAEAALGKLRTLYAAETATIERANIQQLGGMLRNALAGMRNAGAVG